MTTSQSLELGSDTLVGGRDVDQAQANRGAVNADEANRRRSVAQPAFAAGGSQCVTGHERSIVAVGTQAVALALAALAALYGLGAEYAVIFPRGTGEWTGRVITAVWLVNVPVGVLALLLALMARRGSEALRRIAFTGSVIALSLPLLITATSWVRAILL